MFQEKRPTCVTVIGWTWIILGGLMCFSSIMGLFSFVMIDKMSQGHAAVHPDTPALLKIFPLLAVVQILLGALGVYAGISFLKLKRWSRKTLEILSWVMLAFVVGFMVFWVFNWLSMAAVHGHQGFQFGGAIMGVVVTGIYAVPLGTMVKFLRGEKVKNAMI
jgi:hypothetical protein